MHNADTQCTVRGEGRTKGRKEFLCLNFSCLAINMNFISHNSHLVFSMFLKLIYSFHVFIVLSAKSSVTKNRNNLCILCF